MDVIGNESPPESSNSVDTLSIAGWRIHAATNRISKGGKTIKLEPRTMGVLVCLASRPGEVVTREQLEATVWSRMVVGYDALSNTIRKLRKAFDDDPRNPRIIETIPKVGYRLIGEVSHSPSDTGSVAGAQAAPATPKASKRTLMTGAAGLVALVIVIVAWFVPWEPSGRKAPLLPNGPSIAVLPFTNLSDDKAQEYFADGLSDDLITSLSKISGLLVIARNSTFAYKGKAVNMQELRDALGVKYALEGSVRRAENQVRINVQLIDATTGGHVWAERYDGPMDNIFALQDEITRKVVVALAVRLTPAEEERVTYKDTDRPEAYDAFLQGWGRYLRDSPADLAQAVSFLERALELDPGFARSDAVLALVYERMIDRGWWRDLNLELSETREQMERHLQVAMKQPSSVAHQTKARVLLKEHQHGQAIAELERALALDPNDFLGHVNMAKALTFAGRPQDAIVYARRAMRLDPMHQAQALWALGFAYLGTGQYEEAVTYLERAIKSKRNLSHWALIAAYAQAGLVREAQDTLKAYLEVRGWEAPSNVSTLLKYHPYKNREDLERFAKALVKAGVPGYYQLSESNMLTGQQIKALVFGRKVSGYYYHTFTKFWIDYTEDGVITRRDEKGGLDSGTAWIEGERLCSQWQKLHKGVKKCVFVYRNPQGTPNDLDEYVWEEPFFVYPWSVVES
jgi:adenylate cyclase